MPPSLHVTFLCHAATHAMKTARFPTGDEPPAYDNRAALAQRFAHFDGRVIASPAPVARATAAWIASSVETSDAFSDIDYGRWRGHAIRAIADKDPEGMSAWLTNVDARPHGGESIAMLSERIANALATLVHDDARTGRYLIVTHAIVVKAALAHVRGDPLESIFAMDFAPLSSITLDYDRQRGVWTVA
ncbi:histidine phosphatase family protein [Caballeronia sp. BCC1704]|uniref:histidine phosphatase family protein n=1 Tax=Caballeronia sp. BCC1704 TaxID=2676300 RepID=UPI001FC81741|nr:histidine phosphatase family protein [Caballeronia sp. BCC1704]